MTRTELRDTMFEPFFRPREVHAAALILVGYRLYPCVKVEMHPRLTLLAGGNGAGKTTLLDALQTILIADQRYIHMNVAAGQNDRDLGGQLQGRVAWAVLELRGHADIAGVGAHITRRAASEYVDLKPFALVGAHPEPDMFVDRKCSVITQDLRALQSHVLTHSRSARVKEFSSLSDYHRFLYDEGLLPLDLARGGRRQFSLLWRQATQPHLGELNSFLQKVLCHEPERKLTFEDVEHLMRERLHTERQLNRLGELRELDADLRSIAQDLDHHRRRYVLINLGVAQQRKSIVERDISEGEARFRQLDEQLTALKEELEKHRAQLAEISKERDKYIREQGEWSRKYKHHQEYLAHSRLLDELQEEAEYAREDLSPLDSVLMDLRGRIEKQREEMQVVATELARWREKQQELERRVRRWQEFRKDLERVEQVLGAELKTAEDLDGAWQEVSEARRATQELKPLKQLLGQWEARARTYGAASELAKKVAEVWPDRFGMPADAARSIDRQVLDEAQITLRSMEKEIAIRRSALGSEKKSLNRLIEELSRGRLPLPATAAGLVEEGKAVPFVNRFDSLSFDQARECQELIGPLARAVEPAAPRSDASEGVRALALGKEPFWIALAPDAWKELRIIERTEHGVIAGIGDIAWYTPGGPVWIGAEARREQIQLGQHRLLEVDSELRELSAQEELIARRLKAIQDFLPKLDALADSAAVQRVSELSERVKLIEEEAPRVERLYGMLQRLFQRSELFAFVQAPEEIEEAKNRISEVEARRCSIEEALKILKSDETRTVKEQAAFQAKLQDVRRDLERVQTILSRLREEEPEEVLLGQVSFGRTEELAERIRELDAEKDTAQNTLLYGERKYGELRNKYRAQSEALARLRQDLARAEAEHARALSLCRQYYPTEEPEPMLQDHPNEREHHRAVWESLVYSLRARLADVSSRFDFRLPEEDQPDRLVLQLLQLLLPAGVKIDQLEEQYSRLQRELQQIEYKIKSHVEEIRSSVETEIRHLRMHLVRVNRILSRLSFGQIKKIYLELEELPAYQALQKLESVLRLISRKEVVSLREFVEQLREFILKEANTALTEEQIADYRSYIRINRVIVDCEDRVRATGLSSGETLGVNLALCLSVLFYLGRSQGADRDTGMLLLALDEAERLDARALETIRDLLNEVRCQLTVAMPRPADIPDSICHILTPLTQGVTHIHLYRRRKEEGGRRKDEG